MPFTGRGIGLRGEGEGGGEGGARVRARGGARGGERDDGVGGSSA